MGKGYFDRNRPRAQAFERALGQTRGKLFQGPVFFLKIFCCLLFSGPFLFWQRANAFEGVPMQHDEISNGVTTAIASNGQGRVLQLGRYYFSSNLRYVGLMKQWKYDAASDQFIGDKSFQGADSSDRNINVTTPVRESGAVYLDLTHSNRETLCASALWDDTNSVWWAVCRSLNASTQYVLYLLKIGTNGEIQYYPTDLGGATASNYHGYPGKQGSLLLDSGYLVIVGYRGQSISSPGNANTFRPFIAKFNLQSIPQTSGSQWASESLSDFLDADSNSSTGAYNHRAVAVVKSGSDYYAVYTHLTQGGIRIAKYDSQLKAQPMGFFTGLTLPTSLFGNRPTSSPSAMALSSANPSTLYLAMSARKSASDPYLGVIAAVNTNTGEPVISCNDNGFYPFQALDKPYDTMVNDVSADCAGSLLSTGTYYTGAHYQSFLFKLDIQNKACVPDASYGNAGMFTYVEGDTDNVNIASKLDAYSNKFLVTGRKPAPDPTGVFQPAAYFRSFASCSSTKLSRALQSCGGLTIPSSGIHGETVSPTATLTFSDGITTSSYTASLSEMTCSLGIGIKKGDTFTQIVGGPSVNQCWVDGAHRYSCGIVTSTFSITVPGAPTGVLGVAGNAQVALSWIAPASSGGSPITHYYTRFSSDGGTTWSAPALTSSNSLGTTITGLINGNTYLFQVAAANVIGTGSYSMSSASVLVAPVCQGDCYSDANATQAGIALGPEGVAIQYRDSGAGTNLKIWKERGGSRILNATGLVAHGWQEKLTRSGIGFSGSDFTTDSHLAGRVCPPNVFLDFNHMTTTGRCLYYDKGNPPQSLSQQPGIEAQDYLTYWTNVATGRGRASSYYEGNIKTCADKGMRLPTVYETTMSDPGFGLPTGDMGVTPIWAGTSQGVPSCGDQTWTASAALRSVNTFWWWSGSVNFPTRCLSRLWVRCVLP